MNLSNKILENIPFVPTKEQKDAAHRLQKFITSDLPRCLFLINGYAGTGKTTFIAALVKALENTNTKTVLLAPTGKAAKVLASYTGKKAHTIHRHIYNYKKTHRSTHLQLAHNRFKNRLFIVDEVSLLPVKKDYFSEDAFAARDLLEDLLTYVYSGKNCKIVFVGDNAQLPPVKQSESLALNYQYLRNRFDLNMGYVSMNTVVRQQKSSGILHNATKLREYIQTDKPGFRFELKHFNDTKYLEGYDVYEELQNAFTQYGDDETVVLTRSNKRANLLNQQIRKNIKWAEGELDAGDLLMAVKNNYYWLDNQSPIGFIANGENMEVVSLQRIESKYGFRFADVTVSFPDYPEHPAIDIKILLDTLHENTPALSKEQQELLYENLWQELEEEYPELSYREKILKIDQSPYFHAVQVKFSYAITTHKSQGGQWKAVFIDQGYIAPENIDKEYYRWLYTAVTRAKEKLYFINFSKDFFEDLDDFC